MKKNKKSSFKNRIKNFYVKPGKHGKNRIKEHEENSHSQESNNNQDFQNPEEEGDLS